MKVKVTQSCPTLCDPMDYTRTTCGWHHQLDRHEFEQALRVGDGQGSLACCSPRGLKESGMTGWLNWTGLYSPWNSLSQNNGVGSLSLFQGIFPTKGGNTGLPLCRRILYQLSHQGSPRILEWVAYPFSSRSSRPRNWTGVSCIGEGNGNPLQYSFFF